MIEAIIFLIAFLLTTAALVIFWDRTRYFIISITFENRVGTNTHYTLSIHGSYPNYEYINNFVKELCDCEGPICINNILEVSAMDYKEFNKEE